MLLSLPRAPRNGLRPAPQDRAPEKLLEADNRPIPSRKPSPGRRTTAGHCGKPLATLRSAASRYCDRYCAKAAQRLASHNVDHAADASKAERAIDSRSVPGCRSLVAWIGVTILTIGRRLFWHNVQHARQNIRQLHAADQARTDFALIESNLQFIM